jgi:hypothetical protein
MLRRLLYLLPVIIFAVVAGGLTSLSDRRLRVGAPHRGDTAKTDSRPATA